jgi:hypothetical protein
LKGIISALAAAGALALVTAAGATDDGLWLFPAPQGTGTIAAWRAQEGEADDQGGANQALLLEKDVFADGNSAAAHLIGLEGQPVRVLTVLAFEYRFKDGVCNATDPRWALFVQGRSGRQYEVNLGCSLAPVTKGAQAGWLRRTFARNLIMAQVIRKGGNDALNGQVTGLALVFDRSLGHIFVDNIHAQAKIANMWTYAGDNGGTNPPGGGAPSFTAGQTALLAAPFSADEQLTQEDLLASLTDDEWAQINADAPAG